MTQVTGQDDYFEVTVTIKMTAQQRQQYAAEYHMDGGVADDVAGRLPLDVRDALGSVYWVAQFTSYSVTKPR